MAAPPPHAARDEGFFCPCSFLLPHSPMRSARHRCALAAVLRPPLTPQITATPPRIGSPDVTIRDFLLLRRPPRNRTPMPQTNDDADDDASLYASSSAHPWIGTPIAPHATRDLDHCWPPGMYACTHASP
jgi:hypothetical protein